MAYNFGLHCEFKKQSINVSSLFLFGLVLPVSSIKICDCLHFMLSSLALSISSDTNAEKS